MRLQQRGHLHLLRPPMASRKVKEINGEADYRQKMDQVLVGVQVGGDLLELDQLIDVAVESLELLDVHLAVLHKVRHGLIDRNQVFEVDAQDGDLEARAPVVRLPVVVVIPAGGQEVCHLVQNLRREEPSAKV